MTFTRSPPIWAVMSLQKFSTATTATAAPVAVVPVPVGAASPAGALLGGPALLLSFPPHPARRRRAGVRGSGLRRRRRGRRGAALVNRRQGGEHLPFDGAYRGTGGVHPLAAGGGELGGSARPRGAVAGRVSSSRS